MESFAIVNGSAAIRFSSVCKGYKCSDETQPDDLESSESQETSDDKHKRNVVVQATRSVQHVPTGTHTIN